MGMKIRAEFERSSEIFRLLAKLSDGSLRSAAAAGLNEHADQQRKDAIVRMAAQTGVSRTRVAGVTRVRRASGAAPVMEAAIETRDRYIPAGTYTYTRWNRTMVGAVHGDWPGSPRKPLRGTFTVAKYGGRIYRRLGSARGPIGPVSGPVLPSELLRADMPTRPAAEAFAAIDLERRVTRAVMNALGL